MLFIVRKWAKVTDERFGAQVVYLSFGCSCRLKTDAAMYGIE